jgi:hypothetical protein
MINRAGNKPIANRRQSKMQRHALRRFDYESFVAGDNG